MYMSCTVGQLPIRSTCGHVSGGDAWPGAVFAVEEEGRVLLNEAVLIQALCLSSTLVEITMVGAALEGNTAQPVDLVGQFGGGKGGKKGETNGKGWPHCGCCGGNHPNAFHPGGVGLVPGTTQHGTQGLGVNAERGGGCEGSPGAK